MKFRSERARKNIARQTRDDIESAFWGDTAERCYRNVLSEYLSRSLPILQAEALGAVHYLEGESRGWRGVVLVVYKATYEGKRQMACCIHGKMKDIPGQGKDLMGPGGGIEKWKKQFNSQEKLVRALSSKPPSFSYLSSQRST